MDRLASLAVPLLLVATIGTVLVIGLSGKAAQAVGKQEEKKRREGKSHE